MGLRFRKRISLGGIARLNLSATGASVSVGPKGSNVNLGGVGPNRHRRATVGLRGTGLYYQQRLDGSQHRICIPSTPSAPVPLRAPKNLWDRTGNMVAAALEKIFGSYGRR
jgi:Protein of unknown function (DUF4236)